MVNWLHQFALAEDHLFGCQFIFKHGMPGKWPTGEWGYEVWGDIGLHIRPTPEAGDWRAAPRYMEIEGHQVKFGSLIEIVAPCTNYYHRDFINLEDPYRIIRQHLAALRRTIPNYHQYLTYKIFVGTETAKEDWYIKRWFTQYIEPADGDQNGYKFMLHQAYGEVNLKKIINPEDKKENKLKKRLEDMNKALRNDTRKIEVDKTQNDIIKTAWPKANITGKGQATFALFDAMRNQAMAIIKRGTFEKKYKHKDQNNLEGFMPRVRETGSLICLMNRTAWQKFKNELAMSQPVTSFANEAEFPGRFILTDLIDEDEGFILQEGLIQIWILPQLIRYGVYDYDRFGERTRDFAYEFAHSMDIVDIYSSMYFKLKK